MSKMSALRWFVRKNSSSILTGVAIGGVVSTAIFAARGAAKAVRDVIDAENRINRSLTSRETFKITWHHFAPAVYSCGLTIFSVLAAQKVNNQRYAAMAAAFAMSERSIETYRDKLIELMGPKTNDKILNAITRDEIDNNPPSAGEVIITGKGDTLCRESLTGRYFKSDYDKINKAINEFNHNVLKDYYASFNDFLYLLGLPPTKLGDELGWNAMRLLEVSFTSHLSEDGTPCLNMEYMNLPVDKYYKVNPH